MSTGIMPIPWKSVLTNLPLLIEAAKKLADALASRGKEPPIDPNADIKSQVSALVEKLQLLSEEEAKQAVLISQVTQQLTGIARRTNTAYWLGAAGVLVGVVALVLALLF